jgi:hypothetical protein
MNELRKCDIYTQWNFMQPQRRMKFCHSHKWMELENIILNEVGSDAKLGQKSHVLPHSGF